MRGGLKLLIAPDIPVELVSGRRLSAEATPASIRLDRGIQLNGVTLSIPIVPFTLSRAVTIFLITRTPSGIGYPASNNVVQFNGGSGVVPLLHNNSGTGIRWTPSYAAASSIAGGAYFNPNEKHVIWAQSQAGSHILRIDGSDSTEDTSASYDPLTVTSVDILGVDGATVVSYLAVFDRYLDAVDRKEIERNPRILTQRDLVVYPYECVNLSQASLTQTLGNATLSSAATALAQASLAKTLAAATLSSSAQATAGASLSKTLGPATLVAGGSALAQASLTKTLSAATLSSGATTSYADLNASLTKTLGTATLVSLASALAQASLSKTLAAATLASDATSALADRNASLTKTLASATLASGATSAASAGVIKTLAPATLSGGATALAQASLTKTLASATLASGSVVTEPGVGASLIKTLGPATLVAGGTALAQTSLTKTLSDATISISAKATAGASVSKVLADATIAATAAALAQASLNKTLANATLFSLVHNESFEAPIATRSKKMVMSVGQLMS